MFISEVTPEVLRIYNRARLECRTVSELIGFCHGALADGRVCQAEAEYLQKWLVQNSVATDSPVLQILLTRLSEMLMDGVLCEEESIELKELMLSLVGGEFELGETAKSTTLPLDNPAPIISVPGARFCFTGTFLYGKRKECEDAVRARGGDAGSLTQKTNYLVVGAYATESWAHSSYGRKIEQACGYRDKGIQIAIIGEEHWLTAI